MNLDLIMAILHAEAEKIRILIPNLADDMHTAIMYMRMIPDMLPSTIQCEECGGPMVIHERVCPVGLDYKHGYRVIRKCLNCGEMELR